MKQKTALFLACLMLMAMLVPLAAASPSVIFIALNDTLQTVTDDTMPVRLGGQIYIPYTMLSRLSTISVYYNLREQRILVYNFDYTLTFDLANSITYDESGVVYSYNAVRRNGTVFVPIALVSQKFGLKYAYITGLPLGALVRVNATAVPLSDSEYADRVADRMQQLYDEYIQSKELSNEDPDEPIDSSGSEQTNTQEPVNVCLAFEGPLTEYTASILDSLESAGQQAAFFISGEVEGHHDTLRRLLGEGHTIGLYAPGEYESVDELIAALDAQNDKLSAVLHTRARLVWMPGSRDLTQEQKDALIGASYRLWESNLDPRADERNAYSVRVNVRNILQNMERSAVVRLMSNESTAEALPDILSDLRRLGHEIQTIREWDTPVNGAREIR